MAKRLTIVLEDEVAAQLLQLAGSPRRQSEILTRLIRGATAKEQEPATLDVDGLRLQMIGLSRELQEVARLLSDRGDNP